jgi:membrane-bound ClpP family serine protease
MFTQNMLWSVGLMLLAGLLMLIEFLVPSAGLLGIGAAMAAIAALFLAYSESLEAGLTMTGLLALGAPALFIAAIRIWPHTPIGRRILNLPPLDTSKNGQSSGARDSNGTSGVWDLDNPYKGLLGKVGTARTHLLPSGQIEVEGQRYDAVAMGTAVDQGEFVEITNVDAGKIRVQKTTRRPAIQVAEGVIGDNLASLTSAGMGYEYEPQTPTSNSVEGGTLDDFDFDDLARPEP